MKRAEAWKEGNRSMTGPVLTAEDERVLMELMLDIARPDYAVDELAFLRFLAGHQRTPRPDVSSLRSIHAADLYFAFAVAMGDENALRRFETTVLPEVAALLSIDEKDARVSLWTSELVDKQKILEYTGRSELRAWLRLFAIRNSKVDARDTGDLGPLEMEAIEISLGFGYAKLPSEIREVIRASIASGLSSWARREGVGHETAELARQTAMAELLFFTRRELMARYKMTRIRADQILRVCWKEIGPILQRVWKA